IGNVEQDDTALRGSFVDIIIDTLAGKLVEAHQSDRRGGLTAEMGAQIRFIHRRHRMAAHHRMPIDAVDGALISGEQMTEGRITLELGRADHKRHCVVPENLAPDVDGLSDTADLWARIKGGADLVVTYPRAEPFQPDEWRSEVRFHPFRRLAAAGTGEADGMI